MEKANNCGQSYHLFYKDDVLYNVRENGFNSIVPKDIKDIFVHTSEVENNMKVLAKIYDENIMKI